MPISTLLLRNFWLLIKGFRSAANLADIFGSPKMVESSILVTTAI